MIALSDEKIAVVRTIDLVDKYKGMEAARAGFEERRKQWMAEHDTLQADYRNSVNALNAEWSKLPKGEQEKRSALIAKQEENIARFTQGIEMQVRAEEERLEAEILEQVNDAVKEYAEEHGYDVILGATGDGSILHSEEALDITDELIEVLNRNYKPSNPHDSTHK